MDALASSHRALVLVVDDDVATARVLVRMLREDGFEAEVARDGADAIARLARGPVPDVLVTDLRMPHADGAAVAQFAQSLRAGLRVVVVTGYPHLAADSLARLDPPATVLVKPIEYPALLERIERSLEPGLGRT